MKVPTFRVKLAEETFPKTLANVPEWTLVECDFNNGLSPLMRFRIGDFAYGTYEKGKPPRKQSPAKEYAVKKVIGQIVYE